MDERVLAIVPARSGSKGLPDKNVRDLLGKPLLAWAVLQARASDHVDDVVVSTDSDRYAKVAEAYGGSVPFIRPGRLARDETPISEVVVHLLDWLKERDKTYDILALVEPTSPLRTQGDICVPLEILADPEEESDSIVSVQRLREESHPYLVKEIVDGSLDSFYETDVEIHQRQQLPDLFQLEGTIYASWVQTYREHRDFVQERTLPYVVERWQAPEIDDIYDFIHVERILEFVGEKVEGYGVDPPDS
jgi:N-acylneuraminate cytidylyltransferase/CMP-N,N'-diacetyllegionaminic acid synthase